MKGLFNKFKAQVKDLISTNDPQPQAQPVKKNSKLTDISLGEVISEEIRKSNFLSNKKKATPKTRQQAVKESLNCAKCYKLFQLLEQESASDKEAMAKIKSPVYFQESPKKVSELYYEKLREQGTINIASQEIFELISSYQGTVLKEENPLLCISVIGFHHQEGTIVEHVYPSLEKDLNLDGELIKFLQDSLINSGIPDAAHNANEDFIYFIVDINKKKFDTLNPEAFSKISSDKDSEHILLYGISFFKQIPVTTEMKEKNPELVRSFVQKAVCILSKVPIFVHILAKLDPVTKCYFKQDNFEDIQILKNIYESINSSLKEITVNSNELLTGTCTKKLVYFLKEKIVTLWKALFLEKRILVYSQHPSACSTFIHSLLALYPCLSHFRYQSKALDLSKNHYNEYGLPLHFFNEECPIVPYFSVHNIELITSAQGFFGGTSNPFVRTLPQANWDILVDIDKNSIEFKNDALKQALALTKQDKEFIQNIIKKVKSNNSAESLSWNNLEDSIFNDVDFNFRGSEDWIRHKFDDYLKALVTELEFFRQSISAVKLDPLVEEYNAEIVKKPQMEEVFDWKDEALGSEEEEFEGGNYGSTRFATAPNEERKSGEDTQEGKQRRGSNTDSKNGQEPKLALKKELISLQESSVTLKKFGIDWILKWINTNNFAYWLKAHTPLIGNRSINNRYAKNHFWYHENGDIYFGELYYGQRSGQGQFVDRQTKTLYTGEWEEDKKSGKGKIEYIENGQVLYEGGYSKNKKHGFGKYTKGDETYAGDFNMIMDFRGLYEGNGTLHDKDGNIYSGEFKEGYKWGVGKLQFANGDIYTGEFKKDKYHGKGQFILKNGDFYSGDFQDGVRSGQGKFQSAAGESYEGAFKNDVYEGFGKLKRGDGYTFEGVFTKGLLYDDREGFIYYPDGSKYKGIITNGRAHGYGMLTKVENEKETVLTGWFENDELVKEEVRNKQNTNGNEKEEKFSIM